MHEQFIVIMAGGRGERFWPESRLARPKQLLPIVGDSAMLAQTIERLEGLVSPDAIFIITNEEQRDAVLEVCPTLDPAKIIGEPVGRDTAAAVGLANLLVKKENPNAVYAMLPADAVIHNAAGLRETLAAAFAAAADGAPITTIGIPPTHPATGYGYIQQGAPGKDYNDITLYNVQRFVEKPDAATASNYLAEGNYFWNAGMFIWSVSTVSAELAKNAPELWKSLTAIETAIDQGEPLQSVLTQHYPSIEKISIDYAVIEKAERVQMIEARFDWDDVGEWPAIERHYPADDAGNVVRGSAHLQSAKGNIVFSRDNDHLIALLGVEDLIVVKTADATLICKKSEAQNLKNMVKTIGTQAAWKHLM